ALNRQMVFQVTMPALLVALAMLGTSLIGFSSINDLQADRDKIVSEHGARLQTVQDLETYMRHIRLHSFLYVMDMTPERWAKVERDQNNFEGALGRLRDAPAGDDERKVIESVESGYVQYRRELQEATRDPPGPDRAAYL